MTWYSVVFVASKRCLYFLYTVLSKVPFTPATNGGFRKGDTGTMITSYTNFKNSLRCTWDFDIYDNDMFR